MKNNIKILRLNFVLLTLNSLYIIISQFIQAYLQRQGIIVPHIISYWLDIGAFIRNNWVHAFLLSIAIISFFSTFVDFHKLNCRVKKIVFGLLIIWSIIIYVPIVIICMI